MWVPLFIEFARRKVFHLAENPQTKCSIVWFAIQINLIQKRELMIELQKVQYPLELKAIMFKLLLQIFHQQVKVEFVRQKLRQINCQFSLVNSKQGRFPQISFPMLVGIEQLYQPTNQNQLLKLLRIEVSNFLAIKQQVQRYLSLQKDQCLQFLNIA